MPGQSGKEGTQAVEAGGAAAPPRGCRLSIWGEWSGGRLEKQGLSSDIWGAPRCCKGNLSTPPLVPIMWEPMLIPRLIRLIPLINQC